VPSAIWTGSIGFGLVQVPVRLVTATRSRDVRFNQLEAGTGARIRYRKVSERTGEEVPADQIVKGYEVAPNRYVEVDPDELERLAPKAGHTIEIEEFVDLDEIDPIFFEQPYYLAPDPKAVKPYRLLVEAMEALNKVAIGRIVLRSKERLVAIRPLDGVLCLETMRYADEVLARDELVPDDAAEPSEKERAMAAQLVESLAVDTFEPEKFHDEYREELLELIERKAAGEEIVARPEEEAPAKVLDLVAALEQSLARAQGGGDGAGATEDAEPGEGAARGGRRTAAKKPARKKARRSA
jgi:DNA end-binding protein Ku